MNRELAQRLLTTADATLLACQRTLALAERDRDAAALTLAAWTNPVRSLAESIASAVAEMAVMRAGYAQAAKATASEWDARAAVARAEWDALQETENSACAQSYRDA